MIKNNLIVLLCFFAVFAFTSCDDEYYGKISENLTFLNETKKDIYINFEFLDKNLLNIDTFELKNPNSSIYNRFYINKGIVKTVRLDTIFPIFQYDFDISYIKDIWITEKEFNNYVSQIQIFMIDNNDTIYANPNLYNKKSKWDYYVYSESVLFYRSNTPSVVNNNLKITNDMFVK